MFVNIYKKNVRDINDYGSIAKAKVFTLDAEGNKIPDGKGGYKHQLVNIPATDGVTPSEAFALAQQAVKDAITLTNGNITTTEFINYLINYKKPSQ